MTNDRKLTKTRHPGIFRRGKSYIVIYYAEGKQRRKSLYSLADAIAFKSETKADQVRGESLPSSSVTFGEYAMEWIERCDVRPSSRASYRSGLVNHAIPFLGSKRLTEITPRDMAGYVASLAEAGLAPNTVAASVTPVKSLFNAAVAEGLVRHSPVHGLKLPRARQEAFTDDVDEEAGQARALTREQLSMLLRLVPSEHKLMFEFFAATGLRRSEVNGLQWRHLQLDGAHPHAKVRRQLYKGKVGPPKTRHSRRDVPLSFGLADALRARKARDNDPVFVGSRGMGPLNLDHLGAELLPRLRAELALPWLSWHSLRHTYASLLFERNANPVQVAKLLGHANPGITLSTYVHLIRDELPEPLDLGSELSGQQMDNTTEEVQGSPDPLEALIDA